MREKMGRMKKGMMMGCANKSDWKAIQEKEGKEVKVRNSA
jgi:hypothetical protein